MLQSSGLYPRTKNHSRVLNTFMCHSPSVRLYMGRTDVRKNSQEENPPYFSKQIRENLESRMWATTAFPSTAEYNADLSMKKTVTDPSNTSIILFPGQGTVRVGCIREYMKFPRVKELFTIANEILGYNLMKICLNGPQKVLDRTEFNQPATTVCSLAALEKLLDERPRAIESCVAVAGYSVGELTALMFSGAMTYEDGLKLVAIRATAMQNASEISSQGMLSCYCTAASSTSKICKEAESWARDMGAPNPLCRVAVYSYCQGRVLGGCLEALQFIEHNSRKFGLRNVKRLPVSGAFHTRLMEPAVKQLSRALNKTHFGEPNVPVYSNFSASPYRADDNLMKKFLVKQIVSPVKWEQIIHKIYERPHEVAFPRTFDVGSQGTMRILLKMTNSKAAESCYVY